MQGVKFTYLIRLYRAETLPRGGSYIIRHCGLIITKYSGH